MERGRSRTVRCVSKRRRIGIMRGLPAQSECLARTPCAIHYPAIEICVNGTVDRNIRVPRKICKATRLFYERECQEKIFLPRAEGRQGWFSAFSPLSGAVPSAW